MALVNMFKSMPVEQYADRYPIAPDSYHNDIWRQQTALYETMWNIFSREVFDETITEKSSQLKYPLGINIFAQACINHQSALFGEFEDEALAFRVKSENTDAQKVESALDKIWRDSGRNSILLEGGLISQILGGVVFRPAWHPVRKRVYMRMIAPDVFFPVWNPDDYHELYEVILAFVIDRQTAMWRYNVKLKPSSDSGSDLVLVQEHWTPNEYEVTVNGQQAYWDRERHLPARGANTYIDPVTQQGILPFEYFPKMRAGGFYGLPLGRDAVTLQNELNLRAADIGDAIQEASHQYKFLTNRPKGTAGLERLSRTGLNDLGMAAPGRDAPEVQVIKGGDVPAQAGEWVQFLRDETRTATFNPAVAFGQDEGSQRSALTLSFRMWPLTQSVRTERGYWADSFNSLNRKAIIVAATRGGYDLYPRHAEYYTVPVWNPMMPRDREGLVNEVVLRKTNNIISTRRAVELLEEKETAWIEQELAEIEKDKVKDMNREIKVAQSSGPNQFGNKPGDSSKNAPKKTEMPDS
jgi:hypothetical protein